MGRSVALEGDVTLTSTRARKNEIRTRMAATGQPYSAAARAVDATRQGAPGIDPVLLAPYPDETGVQPEELGWRKLPAAATPRDRARAEATWRPVHPGRPCRCSGPCLHGRTCPDCVTSDDERSMDPEVANRLIHLDRYPGSMFTPIVWEDTYQCGACGEDFTTSVELPDIPWGEAGATGGLAIFTGVRHPSFTDFDAPEHPAGDGVCRVCGGYALGGLLCDGHRAEGWTDFYGQVNEPDPAEDPEACPECGGGDPYGECVCPAEQTA